MVSYNSAEVNICIRLLVFCADYFLKKGVARSNLLHGTCQNAVKHGKFRICGLPMHNARTHKAESISHCSHPGGPLDFISFQ